MSEGQAHTSLRHPGSIVISSMKILVLRGGALGDFILTIPVLRLLRSQWPEAIIELVGNKTAAQLGIADGIIQAAHSQHEARWAALFSTQPLPDSLSHFLGSFDLVVNFWPDPEHELGSHFPLNPRQRFITWPAKPTTGPAAAHFCEALRPLGLQTSDFHPRLSRHAFGEKNTVPPRSRLVCIHPGSSSPTRNWPLQCWLDISRYLSARGWRVLFVGGEADRAILDALPKEIDSLREPSLASLATHLAGASLYLGHDTGVSHLAAALDIPCVLLFGPSDPAIWAPQGSHVTVLRKGITLGEIQAEDLKAALASRLG